VTATEVVRKLTQHGCVPVRQKGSHARYVGVREVRDDTVPMHKGDIPTGTLKAIEKDMAPCLGDGWLG
jgi:predicted RNA binding protein YcfA (HicA-like mRNA interferase family)